MREWALCFQANRKRYVLAIFHGNNWLIRRRIPLPADRMYDANHEWRDDPSVVALSRSNPGIDYEQVVREGMSLLRRLEDKKSHE